MHAYYAYQAYHAYHAYHAYYACILPFWCYMNKTRPV